MISFKLNVYKGFLETPPLWVNEQFGLQQFEMPAIEVQTIRKQPIPYNIRLGHKMEHIFQQCLTSQQHYKFMYSNIKIKKDKITLGEIDFLVENTNTGKIVHVELTYKFYIIDTDIEKPIHQLVGPNKRDMFFAKMEKIKHNQFPLVFSEEGTTALHVLGIESSKITQEVCYKAQLFKPYGDSKISISPLNQDCIIGFWIRFKKFNAPNFKHHTYYIPIKDEWVLQPYINVSWITYDEVLLEVYNQMIKENSPMIWMRKTDGALKKFFVVWW